jgi:hypothetical protein
LQSWHWCPQGHIGWSWAHKIHLSGSNYLVVQQIYRGWAFAGIAVVGAQLSTAVLTILVRSQPWVFRLTLVAFLCILATQIVFWSVTYPANQQTANWTVLPNHWQLLRSRWEYSHATNAGLNLIAVVLLILSVLPKDES